MDEMIIDNNKRRNHRRLIVLLVILIIILLGIGAYFIYSKYYGAQTVSNPTQEQENSEVTDNSQNETPTEATSEPAQTTPEPTTIPPETTTARPIWGTMSQEVSIGNTSKKRIALTMDAGSGATQTPQILDILKQNNIHISISLTGKWIEQNPNLVRRMIADGHTFINHTYSHPYLTQISDDQIKEEFAKTENLLSALDLTAVMKPYFRPPYGARNQHVWNYVASLGYQSIYWTVDAWDWKTDATAEIVKQRIFANEKNGAIILMHVGDDITPAVLPEVLAKLKADGYTVGTLESVLQ